MAPMLLGFILGGMMEENLRRALIISDDSWAFLWERPLTATILAIAIPDPVCPDPRRRISSGGRKRSTHRPAARAGKVYRCQRAGSHPPLASTGK
jgi:TctA family transporter